MTHALTPLEQKFVVVLGAHLKHHGFSPSYDQFCVALGLRSKHSIANIVDRLVRKRIISRTPGRARNLKLLPTEYNHAADCLCNGCAKARYERRLQLIHALEMPAPAWMRGANLTNFKPLSNLTRTSWRIGFPYHPDERAKPRVKVGQ